MAAEVHPSHRTGRAVLKTGVLAMLWVAFSGKLDPLHVAFGVLSVGIVLFLTRSPAPDAGERGESALHRARWVKALAYPFWLLWQIAVANIQMVRLILHPRLPIDPVLVRFDAALEGALAKVAYGNSITLTPGTLTLHIDGAEFVIHAITETSASATSLSNMQRKVAEAFGDRFLEEASLQVTRSVADAHREPS